MYETHCYKPSSGLRINLSASEIAEELLDDKSLVWVDFSDIDDNDIDLLTSIFNLHPLTIEDFIMPNARPKVEHFKDYLFLIMFSLESNNGQEKGKIRVAELDFCLGKNFLITFHDHSIGSLQICKERIKKQSPIIMHGSDMLLYSILDSCVDSYFPIITEFDNSVDRMSDELFREPSQKTLKQIYDLKNDVMYLRRSIGPQADVISLIVRGELAFINHPNIIYFRNIYDNLVRLNDLVGTSRDIITGAMEAYVSVVSNRLNEIMKTLTLITTIMMPLTLIASIYGMNFKHMPELESKYGYYTVIFVMFIITITMLIFFRRKKWL